jgi:hypothetical protein
MGVPRINRLKVSIVEGSVPAMSIRGAFATFANAWANRLVSLFF